MIIEKSEKLKSDDYLLGLVKQGKYAKIDESIKKIVDKKIKDRVENKKKEFIKNKTFG